MYYITIKQLEEIAGHEAYEISIFNNWIEVIFPNGTRWLLKNLYKS